MSRLFRKGDIVTVEGVVVEDEICGLHKVRVALPNVRETVELPVREIRRPSALATPVPEPIKVGDRVRLKNGSESYIGIVRGIGIVKGINGNEAWVKWDTYVDAHGICLLSDITRLDPSEG